MVRTFISTGWSSWLAVLVAAGCSGNGETPGSSESSAPAHSEPHNENAVAESSGGAVAAAADVGELPISANKSFQTPSPPGAPRSSSLKVLSEREPVEQRFPDGSLKARWHLRLYVTYNRAIPLYQQEPGSFEFHGPYEEYYPGGEQLFAKGNYVDGVRDGQWTYWHPDGTKAKTGRYENGELEGQWHVWREDGTLLRTESYQDDQKHGDWITYAEDGQTVAARERYAQGQRQVAPNSPGP